MAVDRCGPRCRCALVAGVWLRNRYISPLRSRFLVTGGHLPGSEINPSFSRMVSRSRSVGMARRVTAAAAHGQVVLRQHLRQDGWRDDALRLTTSPGGGDILSSGLRMGNGSAFHRWEPKHGVGLYTVSALGGAERKLALCRPRRIRPDVLVAGRERLAISAVLPERGPCRFSCCRSEVATSEDFESEISRLRLCTGFAPDGHRWPRRLQRLYSCAVHVQELDSGYCSARQSARDNTPGPTLSCLTWSATGGSVIYDVQPPDFMSSLGGYPAMAGILRRGWRLRLYAFLPARLPTQSTGVLHTPLGRDVWRYRENARRCHRNSIGSKDDRYKG